MCASFALRCWGESNTVGCATWRGTVLRSFTARDQHMCVVHNINETKKHDTVESACPRNSRTSDRAIEPENIFQSNATTTHASQCIHNVCVCDLVSNIPKNQYCIDTHTNIHTLEYCTMNFGITCVFMRIHGIYQIRKHLERISQIRRPLQNIRRSGKISL